MATRRGFLRKIISAGAAVPLAALPQPKGDSPEVAALRRKVAKLEHGQAVDDALERMYGGLFDSPVAAQYIMPVASSSLSVPDLYRSGRGWVSVAATVAQYGTLEASPEWVTPTEDKWPNE